MQGFHFACAQETHGLGGLANGRQEQLGAIVAGDKYPARALGLHEVKNSDHS